jgi:hypothetical protein
MFTKIFGRKKLNEDMLTNIFVNYTLKTVDEGFADVVGLIQDAPEFVSKPQLDVKNDSKFLLIVLAANLREIPNHFPAHQDNRLINHIISKLADVFNVNFNQLEEVLREYQSYLSRVNHPSQNNLYAMSKALFFKYNLGQYQEAYFRNVNSPNPMFLKRMDEAMSLFLYNWEQVVDDYNIVN